MNQCLIFASTISMRQRMDEFEQTVSLPRRTWIMNDLSKLGAGVSYHWV
jgi:hypothetical protein